MEDFSSRGVGFPRPKVSTPNFFRMNANIPKTTPIPRPRDTTQTAVKDRARRSLRAARRTNQVEQIDIRRAEVTEAWQESGQDFVTVYLAGFLTDYTVDDTSGAVLEGERAAQDFEEYWTFARPVGPNAWKLSAIQTA